MNRRDFLKILGIDSAAVAFGATVDVAQALTPAEEVAGIAVGDTFFVSGTYGFGMMMPSRVQYPLAFLDTYVVKGFAPKQVLVDVKRWHQGHGDMDAAPIEAQVLSLETSRLRILDPARDVPEAFRPQPIETVDHVEPWDDTADADF